MQGRGARRTGSSRLPVDVASRPPVLLAGGGLPPRNVYEVRLGMQSAAPGRLPRRNRCKLVVVGGASILEAGAPAAGSRHPRLLQTRPSHEGPASVGVGSVTRVKEAMADAGVEFHPGYLSTTGFALQLAALRETSGLTVYDIERELMDSGATKEYATFRNWLSGKQAPNAAKRERLAELLGVEPDKLTRREAS
jgi:hypothetical protein